MEISWITDNKFNSLFLRYAAWALGVTVKNPWLGIPMAFLTMIAWGIPIGLTLSLPLLGLDVFLDLSGLYLLLEESRIRLFVGFAIVILATVPFILIAIAFFAAANQFLELLWSLQLAWFDGGHRAHERLMVVQDQASRLTGRRELK
jgi:hypothetical protein